METALVVSSILLWVVVLCNLVLTLALVRRLNATPRHKSLSLEMPKAGQPAPDFRAQTVSGETASLSTFAGRKMAFIFISTNCAPCRQLLPRLELFKPRAAQTGVELVLVSADEMEETQVFVERLHVRLPVLLAPRNTNPLFDDYKATLTPSYCLVNEQGVVQSAGLLNGEGGEWEALIGPWTTSDIPATSERR